MVDKLDGKEFKLGEYEHDEETGILYVGTHGTVFPGGSGTTGGGGGGSGGGSSEEGGFVSGFKNTEIKYEFKFQQKLTENAELDKFFDFVSNYGFFPIEVYNHSATISYQPRITANYGFFYE